MIKIENERKFLLKALPKQRADEIYHICQYYLNGVRFRKSTLLTGKSSNDVTYEKIIKTHISIGVNKEEHFLMTSEEWYKNRGNRDREISKNRHVYFYGLQKFEVDMFTDLLLVVCEVETLDPRDTITFPHFIENVLIIEVTDKQEFSNFNLAK